MTAPTPGAPQANRRRTTEQERGEQAWHYISDVKMQPSSYQKDYRSRARGLNAMIQINGLGQTLAFLKAKGTKRENGQLVQTPDKQLFEQLSRWMSRRIMGEERPDLLPWLVSDASTEAYRRATVECLAFGVWLRRFAEAELESGD